jgi:hypothetical protein
LTAGGFYTAGTGAFGGFQLGTSTTAGYVLTADASGVGTWQSAGAGSQTPWASDINAAGYSLTGLGTGSSGKALSWDVSGWWGGELGGSGGSAYFYDAGGRYVYLADGGYAVNATGGPSYFSGVNGGDVYLGYLSSGGMVYAADTSSNTVGLCDGTYAINAVGASLFTISAGYAVEGYNDSNVSGAGGYFHSVAGSVYLADVSNNYAINATGDVYISGKVTSTGGYDPPYVLYDPQTREQITTKVAAEIPTEKLGGAVLFFNKDTQQLEVKIGERYFKITMEEVWQ